MASEAETITSVTADPDGLAAPRLPLLRREEITDEPAFRQFGCDILDASPETPDPVAPTKRFLIEFFDNLDIVPIKMPDGRSVDFWGFHLEGNEAQFPSETLRVREGDVVHGEFHVGKNVHTIHWHGIEPTPFNDGVGHTSFEVQSRYTYQWYASTAGTYFYHCHVNTTLHFEMGMYGLLIVDPPEGEGYVRRMDAVIPYDVEALWAVDEIDSRWHELSHHIGIKCLLDLDRGILNDFRPDFFGITGQFSDGVNPIAHPGVAVSAGAGETILIRLANAGYTVQEYVFDGLDAEVIEVDGRTLGRSGSSGYSAPFVIRAGTPFRLTTARRYSLLLRPAAAGTYPFTVKFYDWVTDRLYHTARTTITVA